MKKLLLGIAVLFFAGSLLGATYTAATANPADIQTEINKTVNGDTVRVPAGNVNWTTNIILTNNISLIGNGIGSTIITDSVPRVGNEKLILWTMVSNTTAKPLLSGFEFRGGLLSNPNTGYVWIQGTCFMFRACSNFFNLPSNRCFQHHGWVNGVYDHNTLLCTFRQFIEVWHDGYGGGQYGDKSWEDTDQMGTTNCVVLEDNLFMETAVASAAIDVMGGGRITVRFNTFSNQTVSTHGTESTGRQRSVRILESYNNTFKENNAFDVSPGQYRGGTGVVCSNAYTGVNWSFGMSLTDYRELGDFGRWGTANGTNGFDTNSPTVYDTGTHSGANGASVLTDGTKSWVVNGWSTNILWNVTKNKAAKINSNTGTTITYDLGYNSVAGGANMSFDTGDTYRIMAVYAALDQPGRGQMTIPFDAGSDPPTPHIWTAEALVPIYSWSNTLNGTLGMNVNSSYPSILSGRDYIGNAIKPGWTPLIYPHPLVQTPDPWITTQPQDTTVAAGATANFTVTATGQTALSYQWSKNGSSIGGATASSYTTPATTCPDNGALFSVAVTDTAGTVNSANAVLTVTGCLGTVTNFQSRIGVANLGVVRF